jgi:ribosomal protein L1
MPRKTGVYKPSKRFRELAAKVDVAKTYTIPEAITILKSGGKKCKFDESVDLAIKLDIDTKQADQLVRGSFSLPKGTGKTMRVICFADGAMAEAARKAQWPKRLAKLAQWKPAAKTSRRKLKADGSTSTSRLLIRPPCVTSAASVRCSVRRD